MDNETTVHDITDSLPTLETETRSNVKKWATIGAIATAALLVADDQVKRFRRRKNVKVVVTDNPES